MARNTTSLVFRAITLLWALRFTCFCASRLRWRPGTVRCQCGLYRVSGVVIRFGPWFGWFKRLAWQ